MRNRFGGDQPQDFLLAAIDGLQSRIDGIQVTLDALRRTIQGPFAADGPPPLAKQPRALLAATPTKRRSQPRRPSVTADATTEEIIAWAENHGGKLSVEAWKAEHPNTGLRLIGYLVRTGKFRTISPGLHEYMGARPARLPRKPSSYGWPDDPEERSREMRRRMKLSRQRKAKIAKT